MNSCIQVCNDNLEQMKQVNQRLQQLRARPPSPSAGTTPNLKRRSQLLHKRHGCGSLPLSPPLSLQRIQTGSVIVNGERALSDAGSERQKPASSAAASQAISGKVVSSTSSAGTGVVNDSPGLTHDQQPSSTASSVSCLKPVDTDAMRGLGGPVDLARNSSFRPQRLAPRRESSSGSLSSNAATMLLPNSKSSLPNSAGTAGTNLTRRSSVTRETLGAGRQNSKERTLSRTHAGETRSRESRVPPPARTVAGSRVATPRPVPARSPSVSRTEVPSRPGSADANASVTRTAVSGTVRKNDISSQAKLSSASSASQPPRALGSVATANPLSDCVRRTSSSTSSKVSGPTAEAGKCAISRRHSQVLSSSSASRDSRASVTRPPGAPSRPPASKEVRLPVSDRTRSASGPLRPPTSLSGSRASVPSGSGGKPTAGDRSRTKTSPQILISPATADGPRQGSSSLARAPSRTDISASRTSLPDTTNAPKDTDLSPRFCSARRTGVTPNSAGDAISQQGNDTICPKTRPSSAVPQRLGPPVKPSISNMKSIPVRFDAKSVVKPANSAATQQTLGARSSSVSGRPPCRSTLGRNVNADGHPNTAPRPSTRHRAYRPYHMQAQNTPGISTVAPPNSVTRGDGRESRATRERRTKILSTASRADDRAVATKVPTRIHNMDTFDIAEIKACLFGHTLSTGPPRPYTAALRYWLEMLPGLSGLFNTKGPSVLVNLDATPQVFAVRKAKDVPTVSRAAIVAFLRSRPVVQPTLARSSILTAVASATRSPVQIKEMPEAVEDIFLPGGPFAGTGKDTMRMPPPGVQKPRKESLRRALNRLPRFGTPTRAPGMMRPLVGDSKMDAYLAALEAQTFDPHGAPRNSVGGLEHGTHARRALVRMVKTVCRTTCRNATKLVLRPWRLLLRLLLRQ